MFNIITDELDFSSTLFCQTHNRYIPLDPANSDYQEVLDAIITEGAACFEGDIPEELQAAADEKQFNQQLAEYRDAVERLAKYRLADGKAAVMETYVSGKTFNEETMETEDVTEEYEAEPAIDPLPATVEQKVYTGETDFEVQSVPNPLIVKDDEERAAAQAVVDATPQPVKDAAE